MASPNDNDEPRRTYDILVFGIEKKGLVGFQKPMKRGNYTLHFEPYGTQRRFSEFDGVVLFQGVFESVKYTGGAYSSGHTRVISDKEQLDKRDKELDLLLEEGGFACFLLTDGFVDHSGDGETKHTDLAKVFLNYSGLYRENYAHRVTGVASKRDEFARFLKLFGAASSHFSCTNDSLDFKVIAYSGRRTVAFMLMDRQFYLPSLLPENTAEKIEEYFSILADALTSTLNKVAVEIPAWVNTFRFEKERQVLQRQGELLGELQQTEASLATFERFKRILIGDGDRLVEAVTYALQVGFGLKVDDTDEHREDLKIVDPDKKPLVFVEVKGTNAGIKREHVNQADSHRERAGLAANFPTVLLMNTQIKNSRTLDEKDKPVPDDQIEHAARNGVVILRTLDLLGLLELLHNGKISAEQVLELFRGEGGWLRAWKTAPVLLREKVNEAPK